MEQFSGLVEGLAGIIEARQSGKGQVVDAAGRHLQHRLERQGGAPFVGKPVCGDLGTAHAGLVGDS